MKIKTSKLINEKLDWAVAKCNGKGIEFDDPRDPWLVVDGIADQPLHSYTPSTDWSQGGPIIERESIDIMKVGITQWRADCGPAVTGPTPLIAAMRAFVTKKFGIEIEIPEELQ